MTIFPFIFRIMTLKHYRPERPERELLNLQSGISAIEKAERLCTPRRMDGHFVPNEFRSRNFRLH